MITIDRLRMPLKFDRSCVIDRSTGRPGEYACARAISKSLMDAFKYNKRHGSVGLQYSIIRFNYASTSKPTYAGQ